MLHFFLPLNNQVSLFHHTGLSDGIVAPKQQLQASCPVKNPAGSLKGTQASYPCHQNRLYYSSNSLWHRSRGPLGPSRVHMSCLRATIQLSSSPSLWHICLDRTQELRGVPQMCTSHILLIANPTQAAPNNAVAVVSWVLSRTLRDSSTNCTSPIADWIIGGLGTVISSSHTRVHHVD